VVYGTPTILCVDDQTTNLQIRVLLLEQFGCATLTAPDHKTALHRVSEHPIDLVLIDYHLANGETGEQVAKDIRVMSPGTPLIMLTGDTKLPDSAYECVDEVLIKGSSSPAALLELIQRLLPEADLRHPKPMLVTAPNHRSAGEDGDGSTKAS
jgi:CheY-like chemotaxis protein